MFKILKILNNNGILVMDLEKKEEIIFLGKGVGFGKRVNENVKEIANAKAYRFAKENVRTDSIHTIKSISPVLLKLQVIS